eukprot:TRINITY_DN6547_c0_g1_i1.p1 TRINITY_DN6547_c0_g1~~TRINITY_DN6547_c0_g1_i1.p1  ORF type:complete len:186 (+),score=-14.10 TRINITY_DN6547_c0_g1_i1:126-683(+)
MNRKQHQGNFKQNYNKSKQTNKQFFVPNPRQLIFIYFCKKGITFFPKLHAHVHDTFAVYFFNFNSSFWSQYKYRKGKNQISHYISASILCHKMYQQQVMFQWPSKNSARGQIQRGLIQTKLNQYQVYIQNIFIKILSQNLYRNFPTYINKKWLKNPKTQLQPKILNFNLIHRIIEWCQNSCSRGN